MKVLSSVLIGLGMLFSLAAAVSSILDVQQAASPFDQIDAPQAEFTGRIVAPTFPALQRTPVVPSWKPTFSTETTVLTTVQRPTAEEFATDSVALLAPPDTLVIPAIGLRASVVPASIKRITLLDGTYYDQWRAPNAFAVGWLPTSSMPGQRGNIVLDGHHNVHGQVFGRLIEVKPGDVIEIYVGPKLFHYQVELTLIVPERDQPLDVRLANARWIDPSSDERLTLVTCWPHWTNTHRLIVVARPYDSPKR